MTKFNQIKQRARIAGVSEDKIRAKDMAKRTLRNGLIEAGFHVMGCSFDASDEKRNTLHLELIPKKHITDQFDKIVNNLPKNIDVEVEGQSFQFKMKYPRGRGFTGVN